MITLWKVDDQSQKPVRVAAVGEAQAWGVLKQPEFATRWPAGVDPKGKPRANCALYAWCDLDGNGTVEPDEVQMVAKPEWKTRGNPGTVTLSEDLAIVDCLGNRYRPVQFTEAGAPQYDLTKSDSIFPTAQATPTTGGGQVIDGGNGWAVTTWSPEGIPGGYVAGAKDGVVRWRYPAISIGNHAGYVSPAPSQPGQLIAVSSLAGPPFTPRGTTERLWATVGLKGNLHVMTTDGLFVATLFKDCRQGKPGPEKADQPANSTAAGTDIRFTAAVAEYDQAGAKLREDPRDPVANGIAGRHLCFRRGRWQEGIPLLAASNMRAIQETVDLELRRFRPGKTNYGDLFERYFTVIADALSHC
jgi:hypothetical protein